MKTLILDYSQAVGNTERVTNLLQKELNADMEKIDTLVPYRGTYEEISEQGHKEVNEGFKPRIKPINSNISKYDRIVIATPTWWYTMAPAVHTLLDNIDLKGKNVILVQTHAGWPGSCIEDMQKLCKGANIESTYRIQFDSTGGTNLVTPKGEIDSWVESLKR